MAHSPPGANGQQKTLNTISCYDTRERRVFMAFKFKITKVEKLPGAGVGVLDGTVVDGKVMPGQKVVLVHEGQRMPLTVAGVVLENAVKRRTDSGLSISFKLKQPAFSFAKAGDELVSA
jgi:sulfate adenylyltransferase subunit 1 (EFTu-like GTPase family)